MMNRYVFITGNPSDIMKIQLRNHVLKKSYRTESRIKSSNPVDKDSIKKKNKEIENGDEFVTEQEKRALEQLEILKQQKRQIFVKISERNKRKAKERAEKERGDRDDKLVVQ